jgi:hypothetical protein
MMAIGVPTSIMKVDNSMEIVCENVVGCLWHGTNFVFIRK